MPENQQIIPTPTSRDQRFQQLQSAGIFDMLVIGGGATGLGVAVDAASRGLRVALVEASDFAKGTSSRATKLLHGGVRYLAQGNMALVQEALRERTILLANAPHLTSPLAFVMPAYGLLDMPFYGAGLCAYDVLAGKSSLGATKFLSRRAVAQRLPNSRCIGLRGGVQYWDAQFEDARLALALARTAEQLGAVVLNYAKVQTIVHDAKGKIVAVRVQDQINGKEVEVAANCFVNATGVWVDDVRKLDARDTEIKIDELIRPSQGAHIVVDKTFLPNDQALLVPRTKDGRVLFAVPWLGKVILGTTDQARQDRPLEPRVTAQEVDFILRESAQYFAHAPCLKDVRSCWAGLRPLVQLNQKVDSTKRISREHTIEMSVSGLITVSGGKWTTYRAMAESVLKYCQKVGLLAQNLPACITSSLPLVGAPLATDRADVRVNISDSPSEKLYGIEAEKLQKIPGYANVLDAETGFTEAMVRFAVRYEYALQVEDILARRSRILFLDAQKAIQLAQSVAHILQQELGSEVGYQNFIKLAQEYKTPENIL